MSEVLLLINQKWFAARYGFALQPNCRTVPCYTHQRVLEYITLTVMVECKELLITVVRLYQIQIENVDMYFSIFGGCHIASAMLHLVCHIP